MVHIILKTLQSEYLKNTPLISRIKTEDEFEDQRPLVDSRVDQKAIGNGF